jgi:hypothetical protein
MPHFKKTAVAVALALVGAATTAGCSANRAPERSTTNQTNENAFTPPAPATTSEIKIGDGGAYLKDPERNKLVLVGLQEISSKLIDATAKDVIHCSPTIFETGKDYNAGQKLPAGQVCDVRKLVVRPDDNHNVDRASSYIFTNYNGEFDLNAIQEASAASADCDVDFYRNPLGWWEVGHRQGGQETRSGDIENNVADVQRIDELARQCLNNTVDSFHQ